MTAGDTPITARWSWFLQPGGNLKELDEGMKKNKKTVDALKVARVCHLGLQAVFLCIVGLQCVEQLPAANMSQSQVNPVWSDSKTRDSSIDSTGI